MENVDIGGAIQHLRGFRPQAELAKAAKLDPSTWSLYESGQRKPSAEKLDLVLKALACTRFEFEEIVWAFRRRRLLATQESTARTEATRRAPPRPGATPRSVGIARLPAELEDLRERATAIVDEFFALVVQGRSGGFCRAPR